MSNSLVTENLQLRNQLTVLLEQAHRNEMIMRRYQQSDLKFIGANSFQELIDCVFDTLTESSELDVITLSLVDSDSDIRRILAELRTDIGAYPNLLFVEREGGGIMQPLLKPMLGKYEERRHAPMFPAAVLRPASVAVIPLRRRDALIGWLSLGSLDPERFSSQMATDFLDHMGSIIAICLENVINNERLKHIGLTDPLTGVNNRRYVERRLLEEVGRTRRHGYALSAMYIDIDHFKQVNDKVGHQGGDAVLCEVAARIKAELRLSDALGRFGGEEFVVLLIDAQLDASLRVAERIRAGICGKPIRLASGDELTVSASIGVATLLAAQRNEQAEALATQLLARADLALYQAKQGGRNRVVTRD